jgi:TonB family protein
MSWIRHAIAVVVLAATLWAQDPTPPTSGFAATSGPAQAIPDSTNLVATKVVKAIYPIKSEQDKLEGEVVVKVVVSETGDVETVEVVSGDPTLAQAATEAAKEWKFKPFIRNGKAAKVSTKLSFNFVFRDQIPDEPSPGSDAPRQEGSPSAGLTTVRVSEKVAQQMVLKRVEPRYPEIAKSARIQGAVVMFVVIGKEGTVKVLRLISGHPLLSPAALSAVKGWRFRPYVLNGEPVEVQTTITVHFTLSGF